MVSVSEYARDSRKRDSKKLGRLGLLKLTHEVHLYGRWREMAR